VLSLAVSFPPTSLLLLLGLPALLDEIGVNVFDILLAQDVGEALHAHLGEGAAEQNVPVYKGEVFG
jgi:hypothetical protein